MGTNYFLKENACPTCGHDETQLHIGKSSMGWNFALHQIPEENLNSLDDWIARWSKPGSTIVNEYGEKIPTNDMLRIITERSGKNVVHHYDEYSEPGPNGLARHKIVYGFCSSHGPGTWDMMVGYFR
jgi:hypothetical protein